MSETIHPAKLEKLLELLRRRLGRQVRELGVVVREGRVALQGVAVSYYAKQVAQHLALDVLRGAVLVNDIEVRRVAPEPEADDGEAGDQHQESGVRGQEPAVLDP